MRFLVVTAVEAEREAILAVVPATAAEVIVGGVGPAAAAAASAVALSAGRYGAVLSAGIAGGFEPVPVGTVVVASRSRFADLGVRTGDGFVPLPELGFGVTSYDADPRLAARMAELADATVGAVLTVATVTGTAAGAAELALRYPDAVAEAMEGAGVAAAALLTSTPFGEVRAISNRVGPRDREAWDVPTALQTLARAVAAITTTQWSA